MNEMSIKKSGNTVEELKELVKNFKAHAMTLSSAAGAGHVGGAMSSAEWLLLVGLIS